jgi:hypothetical protein
MTTTSERLLQIAEQYDKKATALRIAAQELTMEQEEVSPARLGAAVAKARKNGGGRAKLQRRHALIREFMSDGATHTVADVDTHLSSRHHLSASRNVLWLDLRRLGAKSDPNVKFGYRLSSSNGHNGHGRTTKTAKSTSKSKPPAMRKGKPARAVWGTTLPLVLDVLKQSSGPMPIKQLSKEVRARGGGKLTGIWNYVQNGMLTRTGGKKHHVYSVGPNVGTPATMH